MSKKRQTPFRPDQPDPDRVMIRSLAMRHQGARSISLHRHDWHQLIYSTEGVMVVHTPDGHWVVPSNRGVWVPQGFDHRLDLGEGVFLQTIYLNPELRQHLPNECKVVNVSPLLRELIRHIIQVGYLDQSKPVDNRLIAFLLDQIAILETIPLQLPMPRDPRAIVAAQWLMANPDDSGLVNHLAKQAHTSTRTLERLFLEQTGITLGRWRQQSRLFHALKLLAKGEPASKVANLVGYANPSGFIYAFRRFFGTTPARYFQDPGTR